MIPPETTPQGDPTKEAIASLGGYVYQIYQSALAWTDLEDDELLYLEVAEDYAIVASNDLQAVQVKKTDRKVTINSKEIVASIDRFVELQETNPTVTVYLRHLTTAMVGKEKRSNHRIGETPTLDSWRNLAKSGDLSDLRKILYNSNISSKSKNFISDLTDFKFRDNFLKKIHFDCGEPDSNSLSLELKKRVSKLLVEKGGSHTQAENCISRIMYSILELSTNKNRKKRHVDRYFLEDLISSCTQISVNKAKLDEMIGLATKALSVSPSSSTGLLDSRIDNPRLVSEVPLPNVLANRNEKIGELRKSLERDGICWITGAAGMGKTVAARVLAHEHEGDWGSINLRSQTCEQVANILDETAIRLSKLGLRGLVVDDLDCPMQPLVIDNLHYLFHSANRLDLLLIVISRKPPTSNFLFVSNLQLRIAVTLTEFTEGDIKEILEKFGISNADWIKYIYLVSGCGHPQLAFAFILSMNASGWNLGELKTSNVLLVGSPAVEEVRKRSRERLLNELPNSHRRLLERLSLNLGSFSRELAIDLGNVTPPIPDAGIILDTLVGSWLDQHNGERFSLSPLLSNFAIKTMASEEIKNIMRSIAESLTKGPNVDSTDMNSALFSAWRSGHEAVIRKVCITILRCNQSEVEMLAPQLPFFSIFRTDTNAYPANAEISHILRGVQVLILNQKTELSSKLQEALACFETEARNVECDEMRANINLLIYSKLLFHTSKAKLGVKFTDILSEIVQLIEGKNTTIPPEVLKDIGEKEVNGVTAIGAMFANQVYQLVKIDDLIAVFDFLDGSTPEQRERFLAPFDGERIGVDMLVNRAWLCEHENESIDSVAHGQVFARLEEQAVGWKNPDIAVCCRKFRAIILDEYGSDATGALEVLEEGLDQYGQESFELLREKARVLYRSQNHKENLTLSKSLIERDALCSEVEKAFLYRYAAISAENEGDIETARQYYLCGSAAAKKSNGPNMEVMSVGLLADAALASWHKGDRPTCLKDFMAVLNRLNYFEPEKTLHTAHCHAVVRHVLLWLEQEATGEKRLFGDGTETRIYPGCVSNPEPHPDITTRPIPSIEMAWYMLAIVENDSYLNAGITENLDKFLPNGTVIEGQFLLVSAKMRNALATLNRKLFVESLKENISTLAFIQPNGGPKTSFDAKNVKYGSIPLASSEQQSALRVHAEQFILLYCANCVFKGAVTEIGSVVSEISSASGFSVRPELLDHLQGDGPAPDLYTDFAQIVYRESLAATLGSEGRPRRMFEIAFNSLQVAQQIGVYRLYAESILPWLEKRWDFIWERQRFLLRRPLQHEDSIKSAFGREGISAQTKITQILSAILPTLAITNQREVSRILLDLSRQ